MTTKEVVSEISGYIERGLVADSLSLRFIPQDEDGTYYMLTHNLWNRDELTPKLFDLSLTHTIVEVTPTEGTRFHIDDYGKPYAINQFQMTLDISKDGKTNITGGLIELFSILLVPDGVRRLKRSFGNRMVCQECFDGNLMVCPEYHDPWEFFCSEDGGSI